MDNGELFNGNIRNMNTSIEEFMNQGGTFGTKYIYDQLDRIIKMESFQGIDDIKNSWKINNIGVANAYNSEYSYDANGNILRLNRKTEIGSPLDDLTYNYILDKNQLEYVQDAAGVKNNDIGNQTPNNYTYDAIGNLITDKSEDITNIHWNIYGKIMKIDKSGGDLSFSYDPRGNRIKKETIDKIFWYVRDASGNIMAIYRLDNTSNKFHLQEHSIYAIKRIASNKINKELTGTVEDDYFVFTRANKQFELSDHLGNVLTTVNDKKLQVVDVNNITQISHFKTDILTANNYYPFGMQMENRNYNLSNNHCSYGFNGQLLDNEIYGNGNVLSAQNWQYDSRLARRWNADPNENYAKNWTPYRVLFNNPLIYKDPLGLFETRSDARKFKKKNKLKGYRLHKQANSQIYSLISEDDGISYVKDKALDRLFPGCVVKSPVVVGKRTELNRKLNSFFRLHPEIYEDLKRSKSKAVNWSSPGIGAVQSGVEEFRMYAINKERSLIKSTDGFGRQKSSFIGTNGKYYKNWHKAFLKNLNATYIQRTARTMKLRAHSKSAGKVLKFVNYANGIYSLYDINKNFASDFENNKLEIIMENANNVITTIPWAGAFAWSLGWEGGRLISSTQWYNNKLFELQIRNFSEEEKQDLRFFNTILDDK